VSRLLRAVPLQNGYIVRDLRRAIDFWTRVMGVGPFYVVEHAHFDDYEAWGKPSRIDLSSAIAMTGALQIELVQQHNDADTPFSRFLDQFGEGMQHIGYYTHQFEVDQASLDAAGLTVVQKGNANGSRVAFYEGAGGPAGAVIELSELTERKAAYFATISEAARNWDGTDPVRLRR
jgi:catechol 2,3-dioxygenase-like lactoylglutathione lyase family enzyme